MDPVALPLSGPARLKAQGCAYLIQCCRIFRRTYGFHNLINGQSDYPASTLRIHNVAVWLLFGQVPFLRENYVATTYFRYVICKTL
jgi:hypothetical protein